MNESATPSQTSSRRIEYGMIFTSLSVIVYFITQAVALNQQRSQIFSSRQQLNESFNNSNLQQAQIIERSHTLQNKLTSIASDLLELAQKGDSDAKAIAAKFQISRTPSVGQPAATPSN